MPWDDLLELAQNIRKHGFSWAAVIPVLIFIQRRKKAKERQQEKERLENKIDAIARRVGVEWNESGNTTTSRRTEAMSFSNWSGFLPTVLDLVRIRRQVSYMLSKGEKTMQNVNYVTLIVALLGAAKLVLQAFGYDVLTDEQINDIANGVAAVVAIVGTFMSHKKGDGASAKHTGDHGPAV